MPLPSKPASKPVWTYTNPGASTEPSPSYKTTGWFSNLRPPYQFMNWLFLNISQWIDYFDDSVTFIAGSGLAYDATIGAGGTYADINAAMADGALPNGSRLLVISNLTPTVVQVITKANTEIVMKPGVSIATGGATTGIQVSATRCRIRGGKMANFTGEAILVDAGSNYTMIGEMLLSGNTNDVTDNNGKGIIYATINE